MELQKLIEQMSLELLLSGKLNSERVQPFIQELRGAELSDASRKLLEEYAVQIHECGLSANQAYELTLACLERLSSEVFKAGASRADSDTHAENILCCDQSQDEEILNSFL